MESHEVVGEEAELLQRDEDEPASSRSTRARNSPPPQRKPWDVHHAQWIEVCRQLGWETPLAEDRAAPLISSVSELFYSTFFPTPLVNPFNS